jgi:hypothetical protein
MKTELLVDPRPISLKVSTDTDVWAVLATALVGIGGIATAWVVAKFTQRSGEQAAAATENSARQAAAAKAAELRNDWMNRLRIEAADYYAVTIDIGIVLNLAKTRTRPPFWELPGDHALFTKFQKHRGVIGMMIDNRNPKFKNVFAQLDAVAAAIEAAANAEEAVGASELAAANFSAMSAAAKKFLDEMGSVLELAWQDIKDDLYGAAKNKQAAAV